MLEVQIKEKIKKVVGIYAIINSHNHKAYIGQSVDVQKRIKYHTNHLKNGKHPNVILQSEYNEFKGTGFEIKVLEECKSKDLNKKEKYYMDQFDSVKNGYNLAGANVNSGKQKAKYTYDFVMNDKTGEFEFKKVLKEPEKYRTTFYIYKEYYDSLNALTKKGYERTEIVNYALGRLFRDIDEGKVKLQ